MGQMRVALINITTALSLTMGACATAPEDVQPSFVAEDGYTGMSCEQLLSEKQRLTVAVLETSLEQQKIRNADTVGVFMTFMPLGSMSGLSKEDQLAILKGQFIAVDKVRSARACT
jgi:hypothetical protein